MDDKIINVFLAFTAETETIIERIEDELKVLNESIGIQEKTVFKSYRWNKCVMPGMGNPEEQILRQMPMQGFNIFVGIYRFTFGEPTGNINPETQTPFSSGMEEEFFYANKFRKEKNTPEIMIFKSAEEYVPRKLAIKGDIKKINEYFENFKANGKHPGLYKEFKDEEDLLKQFRIVMLRYFIKSISERKQQEITRIGNVIRSRGYVDIFTNEDNEKRNAAKKAEIRNTQTLRLHAKSCHAFLARGIVFNEEIRSALDKGMEFRIIMQNPWSLNSLYLSLNRDEFSSQKQYNDYINHKMSSEDILNIFQKSHWYTERFSLCIKGYEELKKKYKHKIKLKVCDVDASNSIFLSDEYLFFEPYINTIQAGQKALSLFEVQVNKDSDIYKLADEYFEIIWKSSYSYSSFSKNQNIFKIRLKGYLDENNSTKND